jgi:acyl-CoA synthetase (AMP-forming)/AMP-acid ligase II
VIIVNPETREYCIDGVVGEIWVEGPSVARGYWRKPEETERIFHAYTSDTNEGPFLRTGDLGFLKDGALFVTGRAKDLLIIRGRNYYPQDIELTVERSHIAVRPGCCAAFTIEADENEQLVVLAEIDPRYRPVTSEDSDDASKVSPRKPLDPQEVLKAIRAAVAEEHDLQIYRLVLLKPGSILKTSSGKHQRRATRAEFLAERLEAWDGE